MKRYQKQTKKNEARDPWTQPTIPDGAKVGVYARQSTRNQTRNNTVSTEMQTVDLVDLTIKMGVPRENIILYLENKREDGTMKDASGTLRIDQREGLSVLVERIESDEIKAVVVYMEDRLFRDESQIEVNKFILTCREHDCIVITPFARYDFYHGTHRNQFRDKCIQAADFITDYIKARAHAAKARNSSEGKYDGRTIPPGFIIDRREKIEGLPNPGYKKLTPYEPHAAIVKDCIFGRYMELGGKAKRLYNELLKISVLFPEFEKDVDPRTVNRVLLRKVPGGYHITFNGLLGLLTNVVYIGWWSHDGGFVKDNHPAIVPEDVFWYAYTRISDAMPDGTENVRENAKKRYTRANKPEPPALLKEIIQTNVEKKAVYVGFHFSDWYYVVTWRNNTAQPQLEKYSVLVDHVDQAFTTSLFMHLGNTTDFEQFKNVAQKIQQEAAAREKNQQKELVRIEKRMALTLASLTDDPDLPQVTRKALNQIYADLDAEKQNLLATPKTQTPEERVATLLSYHNLLERLSHEEELYFDELKLLAQAAVSKVTLDPLSPHFALMSITWRTPVWGVDTALLWRPHGRSPFWKEEEVTIMEDCYATAQQEELLHLLPQRSWHSISQQAGKMNLTRTKQPNRDDSMLHVSCEDRSIMQQYDLQPEQLSSDIQIIWC